MQKKILAVFAHPDDEAFGPGGALAYYASQGVEIHLLCATRGEAGDWDIDTKKEAERGKRKLEIHTVREQELLNSAKILGVRTVEFLDYIDGTLCNAMYHDVAKKIIAKIDSFRPQIVVTNERRGVSGHLDHIAISMITTYAFLQTSVPQKLYYNCLAQKYRDPSLDNYFVYFPEGYSESEITTRIDYSSVYDRKVQAMLAHKSQKHDAENILLWLQKIPKVDHFILQAQRNVSTKFPEIDLFEGLDVC